MENSVAVYNNYAFFAENSGIIQCVDVNTMTPVWAFAAGDDTDASLALEETESGVYLYTNNELDLRGTSADCNLRRINALTGEEIWFLAKETVQCLRWDLPPHSLRAAPAPEHLQNQHRLSA